MKNILIEVAKGFLYSIKVLFLSWVAMMVIEKMEKDF